MSITNNYDGYYSSLGGGFTSAGMGIFGFLAVFMILFWLITIAISVLMIVSEWKIFTREGKPGWYSLIPFLNMWTLFEIVGVAGWWCLVPFANIVFMYIVSYKLAIKYGKSTGFAVLTIFFPYVCYPILAFAKDKNKGAEVSNNIKSNSEKFCSKCGAKIKMDSSFCPSCGEKM